ncbi:hypothetical protein DV495_001552 [Geotrichum candidum]|nr:hypothetical protein DV454_002903 [Geotrichum candidum]KAI9213473.1 hypothetical protein DS838_001646 [Geotrichum bryndzae]KAF5121272.1 hypothetical protein DV452_000969 [Geotrichum candidum]KAF5132145.1 hypothetical protein DV495_001552 [Geotrichum candidum]KAF7501153.1 hypothetical protein DV113_000725 [Geotrichum candidum]
MAEKVITNEPEANNFFLHPTQDVNSKSIMSSAQPTIDSLKLNGNGLHRDLPPRKFQTGLFDCFTDIPTCLCAACCGPCLFHRTYHVLNRPNPNELNDDEWVGGTCLAYCLVGSCTGIGAWFWSFLRRGAIREKYNIDGNTRMDLVLTCCCAPCTLAQEDIEVRKLEKERILEYQRSQESVANQTL